MYALESFAISVALLAHCPRLQLHSREIRILDNSIEFHFFCVVGVIKVDLTNLRINL